MSRNNINENGSEFVENFINLGDVPQSYAGQAGLYPMVSNSEDGLIFAEAIGPQGPPGVTTFIGLTDGPQSYGVSGDFLTSGNGTINWAIPSFVGLGDCPSNYGLGNQFLTGNGNEIIFSKPNLIGLGDCPSSYGNALQYLSSNSSNVTFFKQPKFFELADVLNSGGDPFFYNYILVSTGSNSVTLKNATTIAEQEILLENLKNVTPVGGGDGYVLTYRTSNALWSAEPPSGGGGNGSTSIIDLTDYTGNGYTSNTRNTVIGVNSTNDGFLMRDGVFFERSTPYINFGMNQQLLNYPDYPSGFNYKASDREGGGGGSIGYFYFGTYRTNYNEPQALYNNWNVLNYTGQTQAIQTVGSAGDFEQVIKYAPGGQPYKTCGTQITFTSSYITNYPSWYMDINYSFNSSIKVNNLTGKIFCVWVQPESIFTGIKFNLSSFSNIVKRADFFYIPTTSNEVISININKMFTVDSNQQSPINVYMMAFEGDLSGLVTSWNIINYYYVNICARMTGLHKNIGATSLPYPLPS